jgi:hypothetical protein
MEYQPLTLVTLRSKRDEVKASVHLYETYLKQAKADLAHIEAAIRLFEPPSGPAPKYVSVLKLFSRRERIGLVRAALAEKGPLDTRELAIEVMRRKGFNIGDMALQTAITRRLLHSLRMQQVQGLIVMTGKRNRLCVWKLP